MGNRIVEEMIKKAKATSISNRGKYPVTVATNVFKKDGTAMEIKTESEKETLPKEEVPEANIVINPTEAEPEKIVEVITSAEEGAVIAIAPGEVAAPLTIEKAVVVQGNQAGIAQNFYQEV